MKVKPIDKKFLLSVILLVGAGLLIFWSASLGLLARDQVTYGSIAFKQIFLGLIPERVSSEAPLCLVLTIDDGNVGLNVPLQ